MEIDVMDAVRTEDRGSGIVLSGDAEIGAALGSMNADRSPIAASRDSTSKFPMTNIRRREKRGGRSQDLFNLRVTSGVAIIFTDFSVDRLPVRGPKQPE
jgi:hypothetical protein